MKEEYIKIINERIKEDRSRKILYNQIDNYFDALEKEDKNYTYDRYEVGEDVKLKKGTLLHGTYKNIKGLEEIVTKGLVSSFFVDGRMSKYPSCVSVWNLKQDYLLKDYINFYSGGTILYDGIFNGTTITNKYKTAVIPYDEMPNILSISQKYDCRKWYMEQTKEARFLPSLSQDRVQIGIIFNGQSKEIKKILYWDVLSDRINDNDVREFINPYYLEEFLQKRKYKDDLFTDRESDVLFGIPSCFIEGVLVGRKYEKNEKILNRIKKILPNSYICNLDGKVIVGNK